MMAPVLEQPGSLRGDAPITRIWQCTPAIHVDPELIDDRRRVILLVFRRQAPALIEDQFFLLSAAAFLGFRDGRNERDRTTLLDDPVGRLARRVEFPVVGWVLVRRVEDWLLEEGNAHGRAPCRLRVDRVKLVSLIVQRVPARGLLTHVVRQLHDFLR